MPQSRVYTYLSSKLVAYEKSILDFDNTNHVAVLNLIVILLHLRLRCLIIFTIACNVSLYQLLLLYLARLRLVLPCGKWRGVVRKRCTKLVELKAAEFVRWARILFLVVQVISLRWVILCDVRSQLMLLSESIHVLHRWLACRWNMHLVSHVYVRILIV